METQTSSSQNEHSIQYHTFSSEEEYSTVANEEKDDTSSQNKTQQKPCDHDTVVSSNSTKDTASCVINCEEQTEKDINHQSTQDFISIGSRILDNIYDGSHHENIIDSSYHPLLPISLLCSFILEKQQGCDQKDIETQRLLEYVCSEIKEHCDTFTLISILQILINEFAAHYQNSTVLKAFDIIVSRVFGVLRRKREVEYRDLPWSYYRFHLCHNSLSIKERVHPEECLVSFENIWKVEVDEKMDGPRIVFYCFKTVLEEERVKFLVPLFLQLMKEVKLPNSICEMVIRQVLKSMKCMELQDIQAIFYKLLQFANMHRSTFELFFSKFIVFVSQLERQCDMLDYYDSISASQDFGIRFHSCDSSTLLSFESSILKQFIFVCRNESTLGRQFLKLFQRDIRLRNAIGLSFLLVISHNRSLCEEAFQALISVLQIEAKLKAQFDTKSRDIRSLVLMIFPDNMERRYNHIYSEILVCLEKRTRAVFDKWNFLMSPIIEFCIYALDHEEQFQFQEYGVHGLHKLCDTILVVFSTETSSQAPILDAIFRNLLNQRMETNMGIQTILKMESQCFATIFNECFTHRAKQFFLEDFKYIQPYQGFHFIQCMLPILRINSELCHVAINTLKKCLAFNQTSSRRLALDALLALANISEMNREIEILVDEFPLLLLRSLSQNYAVRRNVYQKLTASSFTHMRESTCRHLFSIIEEHWKRYLDWSKTPAVQFALCVDSATGFMLEPISELLQCYLKSCNLHLSSSDKDAFIQKLSNSMIATDFLDLGISGQEIDLRMEPVARKKRNICRCIYHAVNILILEFVCKEQFLTNSYEMELLDSLFQLKEKLQVVMKSAGMSFEVDTKPMMGQQQTDNKLLVSSQSFKRSIPKGFHMEFLFQVEKWNSIIYRLRQLKQMYPPNLSVSTNSLFSQCICFLHKLISDQINRDISNNARNPKDSEQTSRVRDRLAVLICGSWSDFEFRCIKSRPCQPLQNISLCLQWISSCSLSNDEKQQIIVETCNQLKILHSKVVEQEWSPVAYLLETLTKTISDMLKEGRWNEANALLNLIVTMKELYHNNESVQQYLEIFSNETISKVTFEDGHCLYKLKYLTWRTLESKISSLGDISSMIYRKLGDIGESAENSMDSWNGENILIGSEAVEQLLQDTNARCFEFFEDISWILKAKAFFLEANREKCLRILCDVIQQVVCVLKNLARSHATQWSICQSILKSLIQSYRILHQIFSIYLHYRWRPAGETCRLANFLLTEYTPVVYLYIPYINQYEPNSTKKTAKESRWIPQLIFLVEQIETTLIRLSKRTQTPEILKGWKRSTARDFKILDEPIDKKSRVE